MITKANFKQLLSILGYNEVSSKRFKRDFEAAGCSLEVDFNVGKIIYPEDKGLKVNDVTTSNLDKDENFVVFECVNRLLEKGYRPEHIELEKKWSLGHDAKSGKADICVYDADGESMLLIIECKTYGKEYKNALKILHNDGGQLFSYWQQERSTKWISLYASGIVDNSLVYENDIINCSDDANLKELSKKDDSLKLYSNAHTVGELLETWKETYIMKLWQGLIFGDDSTAYKIGVKPLRKKDLKDFTPEDKIVNQFEEILRHNNVSDKENAFNRLVALFICKLVDEIRKGNNDEVEFQYKQGTDTYETLQDRLQRLHQAGMEDFMGEKIFYVPADYPEWLFTTYTGAQRKRAIEDLKEKIKILKFYSNNDFSFKDVHNEELFLQNGKILVEVVQLFEKYRIVYSSKHQFLGDLFEQLLNKGFKQNEGQFFTPMPITRFIWDSLPLKEYVSSEGSMRHPKVIDYACGAGHFLTEAVEAINSVIPESENNSWVRDCIYGIEKDYRLARVAKISMFMNGAGEANIIFGDGLDNSPAKKIENGTFDILVANPPYSVSAFKPHLKLKNNSLELLDKISNDSGDIETLFVERITQLLKPKGLAAVILPVSILTNTNGSYTAARATVLQNFHVRSLVLFGSKTFGETGTNTVVLFLEKFNEPPKQKDLVEDSVDAIINSERLDNWVDNNILNNYLTNIGISHSDYYSLLTGTVLSAKNCSDYANMYISSFLSSTEWVNRSKSKKYLKLSATEQQKDQCSKFIEYVRTIECEKLLYFALTYDKYTTIITAPEDNTQQKDFLGYDWKKRKGAEGIRIIKVGGAMYATERWENKTVSDAIRKGYCSMDWEGEEHNIKYVKTLKTYELLDFSKSSFNNAINTSKQSSVKLKSKFTLKKLGDVCDITIGGTPSRNNPSYFKGKNLWVSIAEMKGEVITDTKEKITDDAVAHSNVKLIKKGTVLLSFKLSIGKTAIAGKDLYTNEAIAGLIPKDDNILNMYLFHIFNSRIINLENVSGKAFGKSLNSTYLKEEVYIPIPPIEIQTQVIEDCNKVDAEFAQTRMTVETYRQKIAEVFERLQVADISKWGGVKLLDNQTFTISIGKRVISNEMNDAYDIPVYSANVKEPFGMIDKLLIDDFSRGSVLWGIDGDWMVNYIPAGIKFYPTDHCGVLRVDETKMNPHFVMFMLDAAGKQAAFNRSNRASIDRIKSLSIPNVPLEIQNKVMAEVEEYEAIIAEAQAKMIKCAEHKKQILKKYIE